MRQRFNNETTLLLCKATDTSERKKIIVIGVTLTVTIACRHIDGCGGRSEAGAT